jgi:MFS family permease
MPRSSQRSLLKNARNVYHEFPSQFWVVVGASFIDRLGGAMLFPFFTLYLTEKFGIGMTQVGVMFFLFAISSVVGSTIGGALSDRLGRKGMVIFGLVMSATTSILMGVIDQVMVFFVVVLLVGMMADVGGPAHQALVADLLPEEKRAQGFGILRVVFNLAVVIGPLIGGLLASQSYLLLFLADAGTSLITAIIVYFTLQETLRPPEETGRPAEGMGQTFAGYWDVLRDRVYVWFLVASALMSLVYIQMNTTLAVYLRDEFGVQEQGFSYILALNAGMVVLFQFSTTRWVSRYRPLYVMAAGTLLYAIGFGMYGVASAYLFFLVAMAIITIGEMMVSPVGQAIVAQLSPEEMRGRYMAVYGFSWVIPFAIGPLVAGLVLDYLNPAWLWLAAGLIGLVSAAGFYLLEQTTDRAHWAVVDERLGIMEKLEEGLISAQEASLLLEKVNTSVWARLGPQAPNAERRHMRIRVSDLGSGMMKVDLRLPLGLVHTVLYTGGKMAAELVAYDNERLRELISLTAAQGQTQQLESDGTQVDISLE